MRDQSVQVFVADWPEFDFRQRAATLGDAKMQKPKRQLIAKVAGLAVVRHVRLDEAEHAPNGAHEIRHKRREFAYFGALGARARAIGKSVLEVPTRLSNMAEDQLPSGLFGE